MKFVRRDAVLAVGNHPHSRHPLGQRDGAIFHDRADLHGELPLGMVNTALPAALCLEVNRLLATTDWTDNTLRPPLRNEVGNAAVFVREKGNRFLKCLRCSKVFRAHSVKVHYEHGLVKYVIAFSKGGV